MEKKAPFEDISVTIFKEGDRSLQVKIPVRIHAAHSQSAWIPFLNHVMYELELEDIDGVYEDVDGAPIARISSLVDGGLYFARPTEVSAMLRSLVRTEQEHYPAWPSIEKGLEAKCELERCQKYFEEQLLPMSLGSGERKTGTADAVQTKEDIPAGFVWAMKVKQGFKCKVFKTPDCLPEEVMDVLPMGAIVTISTEWGELLEKHPARSKGGKGKVLWMIAPQEGFLERRPLEDLPMEEGAQVAAEATPPPASTALTLEERMAIIRNATQVSEILRSTLRRGGYFEGAVGVHDYVEVHRAALRAAATLMRKDPASRDALLKCRGIELFVAIVTKFCEEDRVLCEYGCWAFAVFTGEGDSHPGDDVFQEALVDAGGLAAMKSAVDAHCDSASLCRYCVAALAAAVHENASTAGKLHALNLHVTIAEDSIRRWPTNPELSCLACWVLRSVVEPPKITPAPRDAPSEEGSPAFLRMGVGVGGGSIVSSLASVSVEGEGGDRAWERDGGTMLPPVNNKRNLTGKTGDRGLEADVSVVDGSGDAGQSARRGSSTTISGGGVFGTGADETSDFLINLADDDAKEPGYEGSNKEGVSTTAEGRPGPFAGPTGGDSPATPRKTTSGPATTSSLSQETPARGSEDSRSSGRGRDLQRQQLPEGESLVGSSTQRKSSGDARGEEASEGETREGLGAMFQGEEDDEALERLLKLAEATKVLNHDNEDTRKAASALVEALLRRIDASYASSTRRRRRASRGRVARVLREGQALGAL